MGNKLSENSQFRTIEMKKLAGHCRERKLILLELWPRNHLLVVLSPSYLSLLIVTLIINRNIFFED